MSTPRGRPNRSLAAFRNHAAELRKLGATWVKAGQLEVRWSGKLPKERQPVIGFNGNAHPADEQPEYEEDE